MDDAVMIFVASREHFRDLERLAVRDWSIDVFITKEIPMLQEGLGRDAVVILRLQGDPVLHELFGFVKVLPLFFGECPILIDLHVLLALMRDSNGLCST